MTYAGIKPNHRILEVYKDVFPLRSSPITKAWNILRIIMVSGVGIYVVGIVMGASGDSAAVAGGASGDRVYSPADRGESVVDSCIKD